MTAAAAFAGMWSDLAQVGRDPRTGGYRRYAWTGPDATLREWFAAEAQRRGLDLMQDRAGNQWAWWGDPDAGEPGRSVVLGSHLDSVPDGGAFDGPLGVVSAFAAIDQVRAEQCTPQRPVAVVQFVDEEGARFGVACAGSRLLTGLLDPDRALALTDADGRTMAQALSAVGRDPDDLGADPEAVDRIGCYLELHIEQGRALIDTGQPVGIGTGIWPHGRWRLDLPGQANHAGTTPLADRRDPMLTLAALIQHTRDAAARHQLLATIGKVAVQPNAVNAVPSLVTAWLDARGPVSANVDAVVAELGDLIRAADGECTAESWTPGTDFDADLQHRLQRVLPQAPRLATGAGHDAGVLAQAGLPTAMLFVRNPTGISHAPDEHAEDADCAAGVQALATVLRELTG